MVTKPNSIANCKNGCGLLWLIEFMPYKPKKLFETQIQRLDFLKNISTDGLLLRQWLK